MKKLTFVFASIFISQLVFSQADLEPQLEFYEEEDALSDLELPELIAPPPPVKKAARKPKVESADHYCLCKCIKKGEDLAKAKFFKGKTSGKGCLCECAVK